MKLFKPEQKINPNSFKNVIIKMCLGIYIFNLYV